MDSNDTSNFNASIQIASTADVTILVMCLDESQKAECKDTLDLSFPRMQSQLIDKASTAAKYTILVLLSGDCVDVSNYINNSNIDAIIWSGYSGMCDGLFNPIARVE